MILCWLQELGFGVIATRGTAAHLQKSGVEAEVVLKIQEGRPNASDLLKNKDISMMFITSTGKEVDVADGRDLRRLALACKVPIITTMAGANATVQARTPASPRDPLPSLSLWCESFTTRSGRARQRCPSPPAQHDNSVTGVECMLPV